MQLHDSHHIKQPQISKPTLELQITTRPTSTPKNEVQRSYSRDTILPLDIPIALAGGLSGPQPNSNQNRDFNGPCRSSTPLSSSTPSFLECVGCSLLKNCYLGVGQSMSYHSWFLCQHRDHLYVF